jgi:hypothetical protein
LTPAEIALGAQLLATGHVSIPHAAWLQLVAQAASDGRAALEAEVAQKLKAIGFDDLSDMLHHVGALQAQPPDPDPMTAYADRAKAIGYTSFDDLFAALEQHSREYDATQGDPTMTQTATPPAPAGAPAVAAAPAQAQQPGRPAAAPGDDLITNRALPEATRRRIAAFRSELTNKLTETERAKADAEAQLAAIKQQVDVMKAEEQMKLDLVRSGIGPKHFEFAWYQLKQKIAEMAKDPSPEAKDKLAKFDVTSWAAEQRQASPFLFGEQVVPATTGATGGAPQPAPMTGGAVAGQTGAAGSFDARSANATDFAKRMRDMGIDYKGGSNVPPIQR